MEGGGGGCMKKNDNSHQAQALNAKTRKKALQRFSKLFGHFPDQKYLQRYNREEVVSVTSENSGHISEDVLRDVGNDIEHEQFRLQGELEKSVKKLAEIILRPDFFDALPGSRLVKQQSEFSPAKKRPNSAAQLRERVSSSKPPPGGLTPALTGETGLGPVYDCQKVLYPPSINETNDKVVFQTQGIVTGERQDYVMGCWEGKEGDCAAACRPETTEVDSVVNPSATAAEHILHPKSSNRRVKSAAQLRERVSSSKPPPGGLTPALTGETGLGPVYDCQKVLYPPSINETNDKVVFQTQGIVTGERQDYVMGCWEGKEGDCAAACRPETTEVDSVVNPSATAAEHILHPKSSNRRVKTHRNDQRGSANEKGDRVDKTGKKWFQLSI